MVYVLYIFFSDFFQYAAENIDFFLRKFLLCKRNRTTKAAVIIFISFGNLIVEGEIIDPFVFLALNLFDQSLCDHIIDF